jgi:hypothetical protein
MLLYHPLIAPERFFARGLPEPAGSEIEQKLHLPSLEDSPFGTALNEFLNQIVELSQICGLDKTVFHY